MKYTEGQLTLNTFEKLYRNILMYMSVKKIYNINLNGVTIYWGGWRIPQTDTVKILRNLRLDMSWSEEIKPILIFY